MTITNDVSVEQSPGTSPADDVEAQAGALIEQMFGSVLGALELASIDLGERLGLYAALAEAPASPAELAHRTGVDQRYVREWCEQQAVAGILTADDNDAPDDRRFTLPVGHQVVLLDPESLAYGIPLARFVSVVGPVLPAVIDAYRTGAGVPYTEYGAETREIIALGNRPLFTNLLTEAWLPALPDVHARLQAGDARVADVACGCGWSSIAIAKAYPGVSVDGFDADEASIATARANAKAAGVDDRVRFEVRNAGDAPPGGYELVCCFESLHDMAEPVPALAAMGAMAGPDGAVFIADEKVADQFTAPGDPVERWMYACSVLHCLPVGRAADTSAATGTVMRTSTLEHYAADAGFASVEVLPIEHDLWRFYRLFRS